MVSMNAVFESGKSGIGIFGAVLAAIQSIGGDLQYFVPPSLEWCTFVAVVTYFPARVVAVLVILLVVLWKPTASV